MSVRKKLLFILILFSFLISSGVSTDKDRDVTVEFQVNNDNWVEASSTDTLRVTYDQNNPQPIQAAIYCDGGDCPYGPRDSSLLSNPLYLRLCGQDFVASNYITDTDFKTDHLGVPFPETKCTVGGYDTKVVDGDGHVVKDLNTYIEAEYTDPGASGTQLGISYFHSLSRLDRAETFRMESAASYSSGSPGDVRIRQGNCGLSGCTDFKQAKTGFILSPTRSGTGFGNKIDDILENPYGGCTFRETTCGTANQEWITSEGSNCGGTCPISHLNNGDNAKWKPRGEIIMGEEFSTFSTWPTGSVTGSDKQFYLCDSSVDDFTYMDGKTVYSPGSNFDSDYFVCRNSEWIQREQCQPGYLWDERARGWDCYEKEPKTIEVELFDIGSLKYRDYIGGYKAGFKVPGSEAEKFEEVYDAELQEIDAECWMGNEDERPADDSLKGEVSVDAQEFYYSGYGGSGFGNIWVLMDLPFRDSSTGTTNNKTYSCVWGFNGYHDLSNTYVYQGVNQYLLNSRDSTRTSYDISTIRDMYNFNSDAYSEGVDWGHYQQFDERSYTDFGGPSPFHSPYYEYPYCPPILAGADIIC